MGRQGVAEEALVDDVGERAAAQTGEHGLGALALENGHAAGAIPGGMRREEGVGREAERVIGGQRLGFVNIEAGAANSAGGEGGGEGGRVDQGAPRGVHDDGIAAHRCE